MGRLPIAGLNCYFYAATDIVPAAAKPIPKGVAYARRCKPSGDDARQLHLCLKHAQVARAAPSERGPSTSTCSQQSLEDVVSCCSDSSFDKRPTSSLVADKTGLGAASQHPHLRRRSKFLSCTTATTPRVVSKASSCHPGYDRTLNLPVTSKLVSANAGTIL